MKSFYIGEECEGELPVLPKLPAFPEWATSMDDESECIYGRSWADLSKEPESTSFIQLRDDVSAWYEEGTMHEQGMLFNIPEVPVGVAGQFEHHGKCMQSEH